MGKQVLLYLVDGGAGGLRTAEIANWTGHVVAAPRSDLGTLLARDEPRRTGVYLLLGEAPEALQLGGAKVYVGEGDEVATRLKKHHLEKDWWSWAVVVTSQAQAQQLTKSQVRFLESRLIALAKASARAIVDNSTDPNFAKLSEAETSNMTYFLDQLSVLLPAIGVNVFEAASPSSQPATSPTADSPVFELVNKKHAVAARAQVVDGQFWVLKGSRVAMQVADNPALSAGTAAQYANFRAERDTLIASEAIVQDTEGARFVKDVPFSSPSRAGSIVQGGRSCNGRIAWSTADGLSYGAWEERGVVADLQDEVA